jgi:hypothetical protein
METLIFQTGFAGIIQDEETAEQDSLLNARALGIS